MTTAPGVRPAGPARYSANRSTGRSSINTAPGALSPPLAEAECVASTTSWRGARGSGWIQPDLASTGFNAYLAPNSETWDCLGHGSGWYGARSLFSGGVPAAFADGSVRFVRQAIDPVTWRSLATRAGGEVVSNLDP